MVGRGIAGVIINTSSAGQAVAAPNLTHYCVAKAGIEMLTKQLALELAAHGIRVNAICPGLIETDLNRADIADPAFRERRLARIPLREIGVPDDVVGAVVFLAATPESRLITGASLFIDGGQTIWGPDRLTRRSFRRPAGRRALPHPPPLPVLEVPEVRDVVAHSDGMVVARSDLVAGQGRGTEEDSTNAPASTENSKPRRRRVPWGCSGSPSHSVRLSGRKQRPSIYAAGPWRSTAIGPGATG